MNNTDEMIEALLKRVDHLEQEVIKLGGSPYQVEAAEAVSAVEIAPISAAELTPEVEPVGAAEVMQQSETAVKEETIKSAQPAVTAPKMPQDEVAVTAPAMEKSAAPVITPAPKKTSVESKIGKNVMAILASVLTFFSLILFAGIAFNYLSDVAKVVIMFVISIGIAAFGIIKMPKKNEEKKVRFRAFYTTVAACGIGAVYITDLVAYFGFECMPLPLFIASLVVWIGVTMFLTYKWSVIFVYICNIGIVIATVLTAVQFENSILAFVLYTICLAGLYAMNRKKTFNPDCFYFLQYPIVFMIVSAAVETGLLSYILFTALLMGVFVFANIAYKNQIAQVATNVVMLALNIIALIWVCAEVDGYGMRYAVMAILVGIAVLYYLRYRKHLRGLFYGAYICAYVVSVGILFSTDMYIFVALVPYILLLAAGIFGKDMWLRAGGYAALVISYFIHMDFYESWPVFAIYFAVLILAAVAVGFISYTMADKYIVTAILYLFLMDITGTFDVNVCVAFAIFAAVAFLMNTRIYHKNYRTGEEEIASRIIGYITCANTIIAGLICANREVSFELYQSIIILLITLAISCINVVKLFKIHMPKALVGIYICIKFSLWMFVFLHRLDAASFVISIVGILVAITCIILGFRFRQKAFRLYGLIVSMVSVIKLILFDISYDSNILRPVGFFIAGGLCFAISFIYSKLENNISKERIEEEGK